MTFIIAELSNNFSGDLRKAQEMIRAAEKCGCDAVKFQLYSKEDLGDEFSNANFCVPPDWLTILFDTAARAGIPLFASVFGLWAVKALRSFAPFAYKVASPESTRLKDQTYVDIAHAIHNEYAKLFASSGLADMYWVTHTLEPDLLFYCKHGYPSKIGAPERKLINQMRCGFSDHSVGINATLAMIAAGATHIEKHFMLDDDCVDAAFSIGPDEMKELCDYA
jgi:sialic acid synthase SpsE